MVGPLLRYDIVDEQGVWNGAVLIVSTCSRRLHTLNDYDLYLQRLILVLSMNLIRHSPTNGTQMGQPQSRGVSCQEVGLI